MIKKEFLEETLNITKETTEKRKYEAMFALVLYNTLPLNDLKKVIDKYIEYRDILEGKKDG